MAYVEREGNFNVTKVLRSEVGSTEKGTGFIKLELEIEDPNAANIEVLTTWWTGWITEKTEERTADSLDFLGFCGDLDELIKRNETGSCIDLFNPAADVVAVVKGEEYNGKMYYKAQFINKRKEVASVDQAATVIAKSNLEGLLMKRKKSREEASFKASMTTANAKAATVEKAPLADEDVPF